MAHLMFTPLLPIKTSGKTSRFFAAKNCGNSLVTALCVTTFFFLPGYARAEKTTINTAPTSRQAGQKVNHAEVKNTSGHILMLANADYFPALLEKIRGAEKNIDLAMFVFKTTKSAKNRPAMIIAELITAAKWGVQVRVFLEKSGYDDELNKTNQLTAKHLRDNGIKVIFDSPKTTTHTKLVVVDGRYSFVGSHNFTNAALKHNNELSLLIDDTALARRIINYMEGISGT